MRIIGFHGGRNLGDFFFKAFEGFPHPFSNLRESAGPENEQDDR
jgi:hypothetical protein